MNSATFTVERATPEQTDGSGSTRRGRRAETLLLAAAHIVAALMLIWPAFWNGFPLVFSDTGTYIGQALAHYLGWDRPPFYSLFLLSTNWGVTLWLSVFAQGLLTAHLLGLVLRLLHRPEPAVLVIVAAALATLTPLPWLAAQLMPDLFTGFTVLTLWVLGFRLAALHRAERVYILLLAAFSMAVHQSHLPLGLGLTLIGGLLLGARHGVRKALRPVLRMAGPALMAGLALFAVNWIGRGKASISPYGSVFLAARVLYDGPGLAVAQRECPEAGWKLCAVLDRLPRGHNSFLWDEDSPLWTQFGGAREWAPEASALVSATLRQAPGAMLAAALRNTVEQLQSASLGDGLEAWPPPVGPVPVVARFYPNDLAALQASLQQTGYLQAEAQHLVPLQMVVLLATAASLAWLVRRIPRRNAPAGALVALVLAGFIGNAAITGALSGPTDRYQSRIIWLLPFTAAALLASLRPALGSSSISLEPGIPDQSHS